MALIYQPKGKASEYAEYALNIYNGCEVGCTYCYNRLRARKDYFTNSHVKAGFNWKKLEKELKQHRGHKVFMSFTSDPYQESKRHDGYMTHILGLMLDNGVIPVILSKMWFLDDWKLLQEFEEAWVGTTLVLSEKDPRWKEFEPNANDPKHRLDKLYQAKRLGLKTFVSLEPVIDPDQSLAFIARTYEYVDEFRIGKWNYDKRANDIDWINFRERAIALCEKLRVNYLIKKELAEL